MTNKFRNPVNNSRYTKSLFYETNVTKDKPQAIYTLKDEDHLEYPSLRRLYLELDDPTEYLFATKYLDGWDHWQMLCNAEWFKPFVELWRKELITRANAEALQVILKEVRKGDVQAAKFILSHFFKDNNIHVSSPQKNKRGRPSKEEINIAAKEAASIRNQINNDYERLIKNGSD